MSVIRKEKLNNIITASTNQSSWLRSGQTFRHQYGISFVEAQTIPVFALPKYNFFTQNLRKHDYDTTMVSRWNCTEWFCKIFGGKQCGLRELPKWWIGQFRDLKTLIHVKMSLISIKIKYIYIHVRFWFQAFFPTLVAVFCLGVLWLKFRVAPSLASVLKRGERRSLWYAIVKQMKLMFTRKVCQ